MATRAGRNSIVRRAAGVSSLGSQRAEQRGARRYMPKVSPATSGTVNVPFDTVASVNSKASDAQNPIPEKLPVMVVLETAEIEIVPEVSPHT
jgi:hypothetical protein